MSEKKDETVIIHINRGPSSETCKCNCPDSCDHVWDGEPAEIGNGWSATCSKCGMTAMRHDIYVMP